MKQYLDPRSNEAWARRELYTAYAPGQAPPPRGADIGQMVARLYEGVLSVLLTKAPWLESAPAEVLEEYMASILDPRESKEPFHCPKTKEPDWHCLRVREHRGECFWGRRTAR